MKHFIKNCSALALAVSVVACSVCFFSSSAIFDKTKEIYHLTQEVITEYKNGTFYIGASEYYGSVAYAINPYSHTDTYIEEGYIFFNSITEYEGGISVNGAFSYTRVYDTTGSKPKLAYSTRYNDTFIQYNSDGSLWLPTRGTVPSSRVYYFSISDYHFSDKSSIHTMVSNPLQMFTPLPANMSIPKINDVPLLQSLNEISEQFAPVPPATLPPYTVPVETVPAYSGGIPEFWAYYQADPIETIEPPTAYLPDVEISTFNVPDNIVSKSGFWWDCTKWFFDSFNLWWLVGLAVAFTLISIIFF